LSATAAPDSDAERNWPGATSEHAQAAAQMVMKIDAEKGRKMASLG
jgi:hypothetical protein